MNTSHIARKMPSALFSKLQQRRSYPPSLVVTSFPLHSRFNLSDTIIWDAEIDVEQNEKGILDFCHRGHFSMYPFKLARVKDAVHFVFSIWDMITIKILSIINSNMFSVICSSGKERAKKFAFMLAYTYDGYKLHKNMYFLKDLEFERIVISTGCIIQLGMGGM